MGDRALDTRKMDLLRAVVQEFVRTAEPVGSVTLVEKYGFDLSPATIRNELAVLEDAGLIESPHTSAGRIPTEKGFRAFVGLVMGEAKSRAVPKMAFPEIAGDAEQAVKSVAKHVADRAREAVLVAFGPRHIYYTGLTHLFSQPEFQEMGRVARFSEVIDRLDEIVEGIYPRVQDDPSIWIGRENPFGAQCGTVIVRCQTGEKTSGIVGILGPMRMDYERCYGLMSLTRHALAEAFT